MAKIPTDWNFNMSKAAWFFPDTNIEPLYATLLLFFLKKKNFSQPSCVVKNISLA